MQHLTFFILTIIFCLMGITPFVPGTEAYEVLILPLFGNNYDICSLWMEDLNQHFITLIPNGLNDPNGYINFYCGGHMPQNGDSGVVPKNDVITLQTLDSTTPYRINFRARQDTYYYYTIDKDYTSDTCIVFLGSDHNSWEVEELGYGECKFLRDGPGQNADTSVSKKSTGNTITDNSTNVKDNKNNSFDKDKQ
ncbi:hypothetical protein GLOIN_2v1871018 [Rhizophagus irregularis DAOM 181602=DAOM 197198]|uniref:Uncharacterized protein n=1 Tax=Rhizophagus irregularis (strain DAOM 181602 / DAOM 197198 / MUCL 43194) TaxID=747089 RepID=A0A2P4QJH5_RHIID|nr:hypothetical protein GLOIN_2v1871018 [Rhizophagus irregularis DAOM 181602=DAOM 197198]POG77799.1 hypothetical protein GLOIN_2v1871018 [Rhizophagus irregularis DAOM 181602=DAOM 197198]|eukprot:XP_025184665.1 hypothetical protein GLOIN_2v1871018 [Rhizophagus irregularis DAOM 181602=DAOM 197198]